MTAIEQFRVHQPQEALEDLAQRLDNARLPPPILGSDWADGTDADYLAGFMQDWRRCDWRAREAELNRLPHFRTVIEGARLHFIHARGQGANPVPLLLMHGWPSSFVQMADILPLLTQERGGLSFDVVIPSMPGYPFSDIPDRPGTSFRRIAGLVATLMTGVLGYRRFLARGSDQGALVQQQLALTRPELLIGLHRSGISPYARQMPADLSDAEREYQAKVAPWVRVEQGYAQMQSLRPETLCPALSDSPLALASWILEKFRRWGDCRAGMDRVFGRQRLIDNVALHWFANTGAASIRLYREWARDPGDEARIEVPTGFIMPQADGAMVPAPREWAERFYRVTRWTETQEGGHFPEWETPAVVDADLRAFASAL